MQEVCGPWVGVGWSLPANTLRGRAELPTVPRVGPSRGQQRPSLLASVEMSSFNTSQLLRQAKLPGPLELQPSANTGPQTGGYPSSRRQVRELRVNIGNLWMRADISVTPTQDSAV